VWALIVGRVDHLSPYDQITLKVCSVIGMRIPVETLAAVHPTISNMKLLATVLLRLVTLEFLEKETVGSSGPFLKQVFKFRRTYLREAACTMLARLQVEALSKQLSLLYKKNPHLVDPETGFHFVDTSLYSERHSGVQATLAPSLPQKHKKKALSRVFKSAASLTSPSRFASFAPRAILSRKSAALPRSSTSPPNKKSLMARLRNSTAGDGTRSPGRKSARRSKPGPISPP
jgi:hypothetical protein